MAKWFSERMITFDSRYRTNTYLVYHWYYNGPAQGWSPSSLRWGGIGIAPYGSLDHVVERYDIEAYEIKSGKRKSERFMLKMIRILGCKNQLSIKVVDENLRRNQALDVENFLRPEGYNCKSDQRIWNTVKGG